MFLLVTKVPDLNSPNSSSHASSQKEFIPTQRDKFTILITLKKEEGLPPYAYFLLGMNGIDKSVTVTRLFKETALTPRGENTKILWEEHQKNGIDGAVNSINSLFNISISRYIEFTNTSLQGFFSLFDEVVFDIPENLSQIDRENDIYIKIDKGRQLLSSIALIDLISYSNWQGGKDEALEQSAKMISEFIKQNREALSMKDTTLAEDYILQKTKTNISVLDIEKNRDLVSFLLLDCEDSISFLAAKGETLVNGTAFYLSQNSIKEISERYR